MCSVDFIQNMFTQQHFFQSTLPCLESAASTIVAASFDFVVQAPLIDRLVVYFDKD